MSATYAAIAGLLLGTMPSGAMAVVYTWNNGGNDGLWTDATNWNPSAVPGSGDTASFDGTSGAGGTITGAGGGLQILQFLSGGNSFTVTGSTFTFDNGGSIVDQNGTLGLETVQDNISFGASGGGTFTFQSDAGLATTLSGGLPVLSGLVIGTSGSTIAGTAASGSTDALMLAGAFGGRGTILGQITDSTGGGQVAINKTGTGAWVLGNATNSYSGGTTIGAGALIVNAAGALGSGPVTVTGTQTSFTNVGGGGTLVLAGGQGSSINVTQTLSLDGQGNNAFIGSTAAPVGIVAGSALTSIGNNTLSGPLTLGSANQTGIASGFGNLYVGTAGNNVTTGGQQIWISGNGNTTIAGNLTGSSTIRVDTYGTAIFSGDNSAYTGNTATGGIDIDVGTVRVSDASQLGTILSNNENLYLTGGNLEIRTDNPGGFSSGLNIQGGNTTANIFVGRAVGGTGLNGQLAFTGVTFGINDTVTVKGNDGYSLSLGSGATINVSGASNPTINNSSNGTLTYNGSIEIGQSTADRTLTLSGSGEIQILGNLINNTGTTSFLSTVTKSGGGTATFTGTGTGTLIATAGAVNVNAGTLAIATFAGLNTNAVNLTTTTGTGALNYQGNGTAGESSATLINLAGTTGRSVLLANESNSSAGLTLTSNISAGGVGTKILYLGGSSTAPNTITGVIQDNLTGTDNTIVSKIGAGTWTLDPSAANYVGQTTQTGQGAKSQYDLTVTSTAGLVVGESVTGTNVPAGAVIAAIVNGTTIALNLPIGTTAVASETLTFGAVTNATGGVNVEDGMLVLQASTANSNVIGTATTPAPVIFLADALTGSGTAGGTLNYQGFSGGSSQALGALTPTAGLGVVQVTGGTDGTGGGTSLSFASLGTRSAGATLDFQPGTGTISFAATPTTLNGLLGASAYATYNGTDWAAINGSNQVVAYSGYATTGFPSSGTASSKINFSLANGGTTTGTASINSLKLAPTSAAGETLTLGGALTLTGLGVLFDNTLGPATITGSELGASAKEVIIITNGTGPASNALTINSTISAAAGSLTKSGSGTLIIGGANVYTGATTIDQGTIQLATGGTLGSGSVNMRQGTTLDLNGVSLATGALAGAGTITNSGTATTLAIGGAANGVFSGIVQDGNAPLGVTINNTKTEVFSGANTYTGVTTLNAGILSVTSLADGGNASAIGQSSNAASNLVFNGGTLQYSGAGIGTGTAIVQTATQTPSVSIDRLFTLGAGGGTIDSSGTYGNSILTTVVANNAALVFSNTGAIAFGAGLGTTTTLTLTGTSTGDNTMAPLLQDALTGTNNLGVTKSGTGSWTLTNTNTYSGPTTITGGALNAVEGTSLPSTSNLVLNGGVLESSGTFMRSLGTGGDTLQFGAAGGGFSASSGPLLVAIGGTSSPPILTWGFTPNFLPDGAPLILNSASALSEVQILNSLNLGGSVGQTITVNDNVSATTDFATILGAITGGQGAGVTSLTINGTGTLVLAGANSYTGDTAFSGGTLVVNSFGGSSAVTSAATSSLGASGGSSVGTLILGSATVGGTVIYTGPGEISDRPISINITKTGTSTIDASGSGPLVLTGAITNAIATGNQTLILGGVNMEDNIIASTLANPAGFTQGITKQDGGTWVLTGSNTISGAVAINGGILGVGSASALGTGAVTINNGGLLAYGGAQTISNSITLSSATQTEVTGTNSLTLTTLLGGGLGNGTSGNWAVVNELPATAQLDIQGFTLIAGATAGTSTITFAGVGNTFANSSSGVISNGSGGSLTGVTMAGSGTLTLSNANTYTGATTVNAGTLDLVGGSSSVAVLAATPVTVGAAGTLAIAQNVSIGGTLTLSAGATGSGASLNMQDGTIKTFGIGAAATLGGAGNTSNAPQISLDINSTAHTSDLINVNGAVTVGASGVQINIADLNNGSLIPLGQSFTLLTSTSPLSGSFFFADGSASEPVGNGENYTLSISGDNLLLTATNFSLYFGGAQDNTWNTAANWVNGPAGSPAGSIPVASTDVFMTANSAANVATVLNQNFEINSLTFTGTGTTAAGGVSIGNGTGGPWTLQIDAASAQAYAAGVGIVVQPGSGANTISANLALGGSQSWTNNSSNLLSVSGAITNAAAAPGVLTLAGTGAITLSGIISDGSGTNTTSLVDNNSALTLGGSSPNTYTGGTTISGGTLTLAGAGALGDSSGLVTFAGASTLQASADLSAGNAIANAVALNAALIVTGANNISFAGTTTLGVAAETITNNITGTGDGLVLGNITNGIASTLTLAGTGTTTISGIISNGTGATALTSNTTGGIINLTAANTYTGKTTVTAGTVNLVGGAGTAVLGGTAVTVANGATLGVQGNVSIGSGAAGTLVVSAGGTLNLQDNTINTLSFVGTAATNLTLGAATGTAPSLLFDYNPSATGQQIDQVTVGTKLSLGASGATISLQDLGAGQFAPGTSVTLMTYSAATLTGTFDFTNGSTTMQVGGEVYSLHQSTTALTMTAASLPFYWSGAQDTGWNTLAAGNASNWVTDPTGAADAMAIPTSTTDVLLTANTATNLTTNLNQAFAINSLTFTGSGTANTAGSSIAPGTGGAASTLTIEAGTGLYAAGTGIVVQSGSGPDAISANVIIGASQSWTNNSAATSGAALTISGDITNGSGAAATLTFAGTAPIVLSGVISDGGAGATTTLISNITAAGSLTLGGSAPNTYSGGTTLPTTGNLILAGAGALGTGPVTTSAAITLSATTDLSGANAITNAVTLGAGLIVSGSNNITFNSTSPFTINTSRSLTNALTSPAVLTIASDVTNSGSATSTLTLAGTGTDVFSGVIENNTTTSTIATAVTVNMLGPPPGIAIFSGVNTYTGATAVTNGTLELQGGATSVNVLGGTAVTVGVAGTLDIAGNVGIGTTGTGTALGTVVVSTNASAAGTLSLLDGSINTLTLNDNSAGTTVDLTLGSATASNMAAQLQFDYNPQATTQFTDKITMAERMTLNLSGAAVSLNNIGTGNLALGTYTLMSYTSGVGNILGNMTFASTGTASMSAGGGETYSLALSTAGVSLVASNALYFSGALDNGWNTGGAGSASNWVTDPTGATDALAIPTTTDVFLTANSASNLATVLNQSFSINSLTFTGTGTSNTAGSSIGSGTGTNTLTIIGGGGNGITVQSGSGPDTITAKVALGNNQTWTNNSTSLLTVGAISGARSLTLAGSGPILLNGVIGTGAVAIIENATGTTTLSAANSYTGATTVTAGTLNLLGSTAAAGLTVLGGTAVTVANGGTLSVTNNVNIGTATLGTMVVSAGGTLSLQDGSINTLTFKETTATATDLTLGSATGSAASVLYDFSAQGTTNMTDQIVVPNIVTVAATGAAIGLNNIGLGSLATGSYTLMTYASEAGAGQFTFAGGATSLQAYGDTFTLTTNATSLVLNATANPTPATAYWGGAQSSVWNTFGAGNATNWLDGPAGNDTLQLPGATTDVFFTATSAANYQNTTLGQDFTIHSLTFTGTGTSDEAGPVTIGGGAHSLTILGGGITLDAGASTTNINSNVILGASQTWTNGSSNSLTVNSNISESSANTSLTIAGGTVALLGNNSYSGGTIINSGTVQINSATSLGAATGASGGLATINNAILEATASINSARPIALGSAGSTIQVDGTSTYSLSGLISDSTGTGTLNVTGTGTLALTGTSANTFSGGSVLGTTTSMGNLTVQINSATSLGATTGASGGLATINNAILEATADITTTRTFSLGTAASAINVDAGHTYTLNGAIGGTGALNVNGGTGTTGTLVLGTGNTYGGGTLVSAGTLQLNNGSTGSATGTGNVTLNNSGTTLSTGTAGGTISGSLVLHDAGTVVSVSGTTNLTVSGLSMPTANGANFDFTLNGGNNSNITANSLTFGSSNTGTDLVNIGNVGSVTDKTYVLMTYTAGETNTPVFALGTTPSDGNIYSLHDTGTELDLIVKAAGGGSLVWDASGTATTQATATDGSGTWANGQNHFVSASGQTTWDNTVANSVTFGNSNGAAGTVTLATPITVGGLMTFAPASSGSYVIAASAGNELTLAGGIQANASASITGPVILSANQTWTLANASILTTTGTISEANSGTTLSLTGTGTVALNGGNTFTGLATLDGGVTAQINSSSSLGLNASATIINATVEATASINSSRNFSLGSTSSAINVDAGKTYTISGSLSNNGATVGSLNVNVGAGTTGTLVLGGGAGDTTANTYTGPTTITAGELDLNKAAGTIALNSGSASKTTNDIIINGGTLKLLASNQINTSANVSLQSGTFNLNGQSQTLFDFTNSGGHLLAGAGTVLTITDPNWTSGTNDVSPGATFNFTNLDISGGTNTIHGDENNAGLGHGGVLNVGAGGLTFSGNASPNLTINSDTSTATAGLLLLNGDVSFTGTAGTASITAGTGTSSTQPGIIDFNGAARTFNIASGTGTVLFANAGKTDMQITAQITDATGRGTAAANTANSLVMAGPGTLALLGSNTYSGGTTINGGTVQINSLGSLGATGGAATINSGTLEVLPSLTLNQPSRAFNLGSTASAIKVDSGSTYTLGGVIADNGGSAGTLNANGAGTLVLTNTGNAYTGGTVISNGTVSIGADSNLGNGGGVTLAGGTLAVTGSFSSDRNFTIGSGGGTLNVSSGQNFTASGAGTWSAAAGGATLTVNSGTSGTVTLNTATYGTSGNPLSVTVAGGTLAGNGTVSGNITINSGASISPGASVSAPGTMTISGTGTNTIAGGNNSTFDFNMVNATSTNSNVTLPSANTWNLLALNNLTVGSTIEVKPTATALAGFNPSGTYQWDFITTTGNLTANAGEFQLLTPTGFTGANLSGFSIQVVDGAGGYVALDYSPSAVPEPGSMILAGLAAMGMAGMGWRKRRREQAAGNEPGQEEA